MRRAGRLSRLELLVCIKRCQREEMVGMNKYRFFVLSCLSLLVFTLASHGQAKLPATDFQCFGTDTFATGLNDAGQVVGWVGSFDAGQSFTKKKDSACDKLPNFPGATATVALGINDPGQIVGITFPGKSGYGSGFVYEKGAYKQLDYPDAGPEQSQQTCQTFAFGINNRGQIVGLYDRWRLEGGKWVCDGPDKPFLREADGTFLTPQLGFTESAQINGINPRGLTIGNYLDNCGSDACKEYGFLREPKGTTRIIAVEGAWDTMPTGINPQGQVVGRYFLEPWLAPVGPCHSFWLDSKDATPVEIRYPNAAYTCVGGINAPGEVSGAWTNDWAAGTWHGFVVDLDLVLSPAP
jgi:hypothetical protein